MRRKGIPASAPVAPSLSGQPATQANARKNAAESACEVVGEKTVLVAKASAVAPGNFIDRNPVKILGFVVAAGLVVGGLLERPRRRFRARSEGIGSMALSINCGGDLSNPPPHVKARLRRLTSADAEVVKS